MKRSINIILMLFTCSLSIGQAADSLNRLSLDDAVMIALEKNYAIRIAELTAEQSEIDASIGNAGFLPTIDASASYTYSSSDTEIEFASPQAENIDRKGAVSETINAGVNTNYILYQGGSRNYRFRQFENLSFQSQLQLQKQMENTILQVINQYLNTSNLQEAYELSRESVTLSLDRYERASSNYEFGNLSKLELLNAEVDLRTDSTNMIQARLDYEKAINNLNNSMGISPDSSYTVQNEFLLQTNMILSDILTEALNQNTDIQLNKANITTSELDKKLANTGYLPTLRISGGYNYTNTQNEAGFVETQTNLGWSLGPTFSYTIFDGFSRKRAVEKAELDIEKQQTSLQQAENQLKTNILTAFKDYNLSKQQLALSKRNLEAAKLNYERSSEAFNTGQINGIELREAQLNLLNSKYQVSLQRIQIKLAETQLQFYSGMLIDVAQER